jgi:cobalt/nickel transport system permease protein
MHIHFLDPYRSLSSPIHRLDGRVKFILTLAFILTTALTPMGAWPVYLLLLSLILSVEILSGLGVRYVLKRALLALPFVLAALPVLFTTQGSALFHLPFSLDISRPGLERFASIVVKSWLSVQAAIVLAASTPFPELLVAMRAVKVPRLLVALYGLTCSCWPMRPCG